MASYIKRMPWGQTKPPLGYGIDGASPYSQDLVFAPIFNEQVGVPLDLVTKQSAVADGTGWGVSLPGSVKTFNGATDRLDWSSITNLTGKSFTYVAKVFIVASAGIKYLFNAHPAGDSMWGIVISKGSGNQLFVSINVAGQEAICEFGVPPLSSWISLAVVVPTNAHLAMNTVKLYIDGVEQTVVNSASKTGTLTDIVGSWSVGGRIYDDARNFDGKISHVNIFTRNLTAAEILHLHANPYSAVEGWNYERTFSIPAATPAVTAVAPRTGSYVKKMPWGQTKPPLGYGLDKSAPLAAGFVGCWLFNEGAGALASNLANYSINNMLIASPAIYETGNVATKTTGTIATANNLPTNDPLSIVGQITIIINAIFTGNQPAVNTQYALVSTGYTSTVGYFLDYRAIGSTKQFAGGRFQSTNITAAYIATWAQNTQHQIALTNNGVVWQLYYDGKPVGTSFSDTGATASDARRLGIGCMDLSGTLQRIFPGIIINTSLFNRALSAAEIQELYAQPYAMIEGWNYERTFSIPGVSSSSSNSSLSYGGIPFGLFKYLGMPLSEIPPALVPLVLKLRRYLYGAHTTGPFSGVK